MEMVCKFNHINIGPCKLKRIAGRSIHWVEAGSGPAVVLIHGGRAWAYAWRYQIEELAEIGYQVIAPDLPGSGYSDVSRATDYSISALSGFLGDLLDEIKISRLCSQPVPPVDFPFSISLSAVQSEWLRWFWLRPAACLTICLSYGG